MLYVVSAWLFWTVRRYHLSIFLPLLHLLKQPDIDPQQDRKADGRHKAGSKKPVRSRKIKQRHDQRGHIHPHEQNDADDRRDLLRGCFFLIVILFFLIILHTVKSPSRRFPAVFQLFIFQPRAFQSSTSKASSLLFFGSGLPSPCRTNSMVKKATTTKNAA